MSSLHRVSRNPKPALNGRRFVLAHDGGLFYGGREDLMGAPCIRVVKSESDAVGFSLKQDANNAVRAMCRPGWRVKACGGGVK